MTSTIKTITEYKVSWPEEGKAILLPLNKEKAIAGYIYFSRDGEPWFYQDKDNPEPGTPLSDWFGEPWYYLDEIISGETLMVDKENFRFLVAWAKKGIEGQVNLKLIYGTGPVTKLSKLEALLQDKG